MSDVRLAARGLLRRPVFTATVVATLALGIGANTAIFSVADALLFREPPYPHPEQLVSVWGASAGEYSGLKATTHSFASIASYAAWAMNVGDAASTNRADGADVSDNLFPTLGIAPAIGRNFSTGANSPGAAREVMLSDALWRSQFGGDIALIGKTILVEGVPRTVVGVMPSAFHFPTIDTKLWFNSTFDAANAGTYWGWGKFKFVARLRNGTSPQQAETDVRLAAQQIRKLNPLWDPGPKYGTDAAVAALQAQLAGPARTTMFVLLAVVFSLLLIACANVANLVLVRTFEREREFAVRAALGCSRLRLGWQLLSENLLLSALGGVVALGVASVGVRLLSDSLPPQIPRSAVIGIDSRVLLFTIAITLLTGLIVALLPALRVTAAVRIKGFSQLAASRGNSRNAGQRRAADVLTVLQLSLAVVLVAGSGLLLRTFDALRSSNTGFVADRVIAARVTMPSGTYRDPARTTAFVDALLANLNGNSVLGQVAAVDRPPLRAPVYGSAVRIEHQFEDLTRTLPTIDHAQSVSPAYFNTMGIRIVRGREFTAQDRAGGAPVAIISESVAKKYWPNADAVGQRIGAPFASPWMTIVGVAAEVQQDSINGNVESTLYRPLAQMPQTDITIVARTSADIPYFMNAVKSAVSTIDGQVPVSDVRTMRDIVSVSLARARFTAVLMLAFALVALCISAVGIYGVVSATVLQRTREMGVRMALGASPIRVLSHVMSRGAVLSLWGVSAGIVGALAVTRWLGTLLYGVTATDARTFIVAPVLLLTTGLVATWIPARRVVRASPVAALHND